MSMMAVVIPPNVSSGQQMHVRTPAGTTIGITVPPGVSPGQTIHVRIPEAAAPPPAPAAPPPPRPPPAAAGTGARRASAQHRFEASAAAPAVAAASSAMARFEAEQSSGTIQISDVQGARAQERAAEEARVASTLAAREREVYERRVVKAELESLETHLGDIGWPVKDGMKARPVATLPASSKQQLKPLLEELDEALTTQKKLHAISDYTAKNPQRTFNKDEVMAVLVKVPNTLRWPDVLSLLQPRMSGEASSWADIAIAAASDPYIW